VKDANHHCRQPGWHGGGRPRWPHPTARSPPARLYATLSGKALGVSAVWIDPAGPAAPDRRRCARPGPARQHQARQGNRGRPESRTGARCPTRRSDRSTPCSASVWTRRPPEVLESDGAAGVSGTGTPPDATGAAGDETVDESGGLEVNGPNADAAKWRTKWRAVEAERDALTKRHASACRQSAPTTPEPTNMPCSRK